MADDSSQQRKPNLRRAVEDVKALATLLGRRLKSRSPAVLFAIGVVVTIVLALVVVLTLALTGGAKALSDNAALIGALVALGGVFTAQMVSISLDERRAHEARDIEAQRAHETALQNHIEAVGELLIEKSLREAKPGDNLSTVVRAQTLSVLEGLDPDRKRTLLLFLHESGLIYKDKRVVSLAAADLSEANLRGARLREANLSWANLSRANLTEAFLGGANLNGSILMRANVQGATGVTSQRLEQHAYSLQGAIMPDGSKHP